MSFESSQSHEKELPTEYKFLDEKEKEQYRDAVLGILQEYPDNFFTGLFEKVALADYEQNQIAVSFNEEGLPVGCVFFNPETNECDWLAVSKRVEGSKAEVAKKLFQIIFDTVPKGTKIFWYINTEDAEFEGKPVGAYFERGRKLYADMGAKFTRVENKLGLGNHAYLVEIIV